MSDPFAHHPSTENLEASTAMTKVTADDMAHVGQRAARLIKPAVSAKTRTVGKTLAAPPVTTVPPVEVKTPVSPPVEVAAPVIKAAAKIARDAAPVTPADTVVEIGKAVQVSVEAFKIEVQSPISGETDALKDLQNKISQMVQANLDETLSFWMSMVGIKSPADAVELNNRHMLRQMDTFVTQSRELSTLANKAASASMTQLVDSFSRIRG